MSRISTDDTNLANAAFMLGFFSILSAWGFELIGGFVPCELCLGQRWPYYLGLPILAITMIFWQKFPKFIVLMLTLLVAVIFLWSTYLGAFHAGVEWKFWPGPAACTGTGEGVDFSALSNINDVKVVPCDEPQFRFLGISFAGYNALLSILIAFLLARSAWGQRKAL